LPSFKPSKDKEQGSQLGKGGIGFIPMHFLVPFLPSTGLQGYQGKHDQHWTVYIFHFYDIKF
jgi:hypothetical protein